MSGIFGFIQKEIKKNNIINIEKMQKWNRAYGRDGENVLVGTSYGLGCCYENFATTGLQKNMVLQMDEQYAVIDALLYNREELLQKCSCTQEVSDEELLFTYLNQFGMDALKDVNGDFAGAVYHADSNTLILFRDHMGVRPLFYCADDTLVAFSTDIRGLTALSQIDASINEEWIYKTVAGYTTLSTENTEYANIFCAKPAGYMKFILTEKDVRKEKKSYWQLGSRKIRFAWEEDYKAQLKELITDSVKRRLDRVPGLVGAELSGGLDSGVIDILINRLGRECVYFSWSIDPKDLPMAENDERLVIEDICQQEKINCNYGKRVLELGVDTNIAENMRQTGSTIDMGESQALRYALPPYINALAIGETSEYISKSGARVVFTGHGGDEGVSHRCNPFELFYHQEYFHYWRHMWFTSHGQKRRVVRTLRYCYQNLKYANIKFNKPFHNPFGAPELLKSDFADKYNEKEMPKLQFAYNPKEYVKQGGSRNRLDNVALLGAYSGVRYLIPYLDYRVIDYAVSIPRHLYLKGGENRYIFREAFKDIMPESLYTLQFKEDNSRKNMEPNPNWFEEFNKRKKEVLSKLDRKVWSRYLNYEVIEQWMQRGKPSEEERFGEECILRCLFSCALAENLVKKSREV